jgi:hypothetical protein
MNAVMDTKGHGTHELLLGQSKCRGRKPVNAALSRWTDEGRKTCLLRVYSSLIEKKNKKKKHTRASQQKLTAYERTASLDTAYKKNKSILLSVTNTAHAKINRPTTVLRPIVFIRNFLHIRVHELD